ncbi:MAG: hypothetical protein LQ340_003610, partial [Diploschistes diacapsis]
PSKHHLAPPQDPTAKPLTSFFAKPHQRAAALDRTRRAAGRMRLAFGVPLPDVPESGEEVEFRLPAGFMSEKGMRAAARRCRRERR